ncbi:hypothetical protein LINGRAHAP2_LOCUS14102, partial [Linum grandiflorum]
NKLQEEEHVRRQLLYSNPAFIIKAAYTYISYLNQNGSMMHVRNELSMKLIVHCRSGDDDLGAQVVRIDSEFSWRFTEVMSTLFWCKINVFISMPTTEHNIAPITGWSMILEFTLTSLDVLLVIIHGQFSRSFTTFSFYSGSAADAEIFNW